MPHRLGLPGRLAPNPANHRRLDPAPSTLAGSRLGLKFPSNPLDVLLNSPKYCLLAGAASQWKCLPRRCSLSALHDRSSVNPWRKSKDVSVPIPVLRLSGAGSLLCSARRGRGGLEDGWDGGPDIRTYVGHALYARNEHAWDGVWSDVRLEGVAARGEYTAAGWRTRSALLGDVILFLHMALIPASLAYDRPSQSQHRHIAASAG
jgi:hypothetical protein